MREIVGEVAALYRYPVKSMRGEGLAEGMVGWHGLAGDRRLALRRCGERGGFPWLTASRLPELLLFTPWRDASAGGGGLPTHVRTPEGRDLAPFGAELADEVGQRSGMMVEMVHLDRGIFDEASVSLITSATVGAISQRSGVPGDVRRFRPNVVLASASGLPFGEDDWVGGILSFGRDGEGAALVVTNRDERCAMVTYDADSAHPSPEVLRAIVRERGNRAGVYATVLRPGRLAVGQPVVFERVSGGGGARP